MTRAAAPSEPLVCLSAALLLGVTAAVLWPHLASHWIPPGGRSWPTRLSIGATTGTATGLLTWRHAPHQPGEYAVLAAWLTFVTGGVILAVIDLEVRRLPTPIIAATTTAVTLLLTVGAVLASRPAVVVMPLLAAITVGGAYVLLAATGASNIGMGDVRLAGLTGLILGTAGWQTVLLGAALPYLLAAPFAFTTHRRHAPGRSPQIPFGPFLVSGTVLVGILATTL